MACRYLPILIVLALNLAPASAQKETRPDISRFSFVTGPKGDRPHVPGLNAVLLFTGEQKEKLVLARQETVGSEAVRSAGRKVKNDPNATEADRQAARKLSEEAQAQYDRRVAEILTPAQKALVQRLQVLYGQAREAVAAEYGPKLTASKGNEPETVKLRLEARDALTADFTRRVNEILTPEQRAAFERAAAEEKERDAAVKPKNKG
jgi:Spy/CpxP family protein refolding chaperone